MPESETEEAAQGPLAGLQLRAVALGVLVDHMSTLIFTTLLVAIVASEDLFSKNAADAEAARLALAGSPSFLLSTLLGGSICTVLAAFIGSRYAADRFVLHGICIAVASAAIVLAADSSLGAAVSWVAVVGWVMLLPAGWLGGTLARWAVAQQLAEQHGAADD